MAPPSTTLDSSSPHVEVRSVGEVELFILNGEFDAYSTPWLEDQLVAAIERGHFELALDMCGVTFVDMSTLNVVVRAMKRVYRHNGHLVVACAQRPVLRAIDLAGLKHAVKVYDRRDQAVAALSERKARR
jgi:anti-sigma B factor antagonist